MQCKKNVFAYLRKGKVFTCNLKELINIFVDIFTHVHISLASLNVQISFFKHTSKSSFFLRFVNFLHFFVNSIQNHPTFSHTNYSVERSFKCFLFLIKNQIPIAEIIKQPKKVNKIYIWFKMLHNVLLFKLNRKYSNVIDI